MFFLLNLVVPSFLLLSSLIFIFSSSSWFIAWMGLEMNMMAFMPMIITTNKLSSEAALKYFFSQVLGSTLIFLFTFLMVFYSSSMYYSKMSLAFTWIVVGALMLKLGAAPFHFWFPAMVEGLTWNTTLLLMTVQKSGPLSLILLMSGLAPFIIILFMIMSTTIGALSGFNQLMTRKLMSFSSIAHVGWLLCGTLITKMLTMFYFLLYSLMTCVVVFIFKFCNTIHFNQMTTYHNTMIIYMLLFYLNLLSLGGLPPFLGFVPKWMIIQSGVQYLLSSLIIMVLNSIITLYFYLRLTYAATMMMTSRTSIKFILTKMSFFIVICVGMPLMSLPLIIFFL